MSILSSSPAQEASAISGNNASHATGKSSANRFYEFIRSISPVGNEPPAEQAHAQEIILEEHWVEDNHEHAISEAIMGDGQ